MGSKRELLSTIDQQQEKLTKYETRLRDVVQAYKGLLKEKEALEASFKALTVLKPEQATRLDNAGSSETNETHEAEAVESNYEPNEKNEVRTQAPPEPSENDTMSKLQSKISILMNSLSTLTAEKTRIESSFQADKKRSMQEKEEYDKKLEKERHENQSRYEEVMVELNYVKGKLKHQQQERDKDESNHALMLRELQKLVSSERISKEFLQEKLEEAQHILKKKSQQLDKAEEYEAKLQEVSAELRSVRERLQLSEDVANKPSPMLIDLQNQLSEMKLRHHVNYEQEKVRANEAERRLISGADANEGRVAALELKLSELSDFIGNYDRLRIQDQTAIIKLKDRVTQLDMENIALAKAACNVTSQANDQEKSDADYSNLSVQELIEKITKLKNILRVSNQKAEIPVDIDDILKVDFANVIQPQRVEDHTQCQMEIQRWKVEYEKYKNRAQSVLKNKNSKDNDAVKEINQLKNLVSELKDKISVLKSQLEDEENMHKRSVAELNHALTQTKNSYIQKLASAEEHNKGKILNLEQQMQKQRERTLAVLDEKDEELSLLRSSSNPYIPKGGRHKRNSSSSSEKKFSSFVGEYNDVDDCNKAGSEVISMLSHSKKSNKSEAQMLHYQQEISRLDVELKSLRKSKRDLESSFRELQCNCSSKEERYCDEIDELKAKLSRIELSSKKTTNLEYLKNVVFNFVCSKDCEGKLHMLKAIAAVLHFTPKELASARQHVTFLG